MKSIGKKFLFKVSVTLIFCLGLLVCFVFCPTLSYAYKTTYKNFTIYHDKPLNEDFKFILENSFEKLTSYEVFDKNICIDVCLNDGSYYPRLIEVLMGRDVIRSFANKSVIHGDINATRAACLYFGKERRELKLSQWLSHSFTHCLQFNKYGLWKSNPIARYAEWKWEGYAEYTSFGAGYNLSTLVSKYLEVKGGQSWVEMRDNSKTTLNHLKYLIMVKYCLEVKGLSYDEVLRILDSEESVYKEMLSWHQSSSVIP